jgi:hypothetical protein
LSISTPAKLPKLWRSYVAQNMEMVSVEDDLDDIVNTSEEFS